jgi:hypothetical protein
MARAAPQQQAVALARAAWILLPHEGSDAPDWLLGSALEQGRAAGAVRAVTAVELGRRAGIAARPVRGRDCWAIYLGEGDEPVAADVGRPAPDQPSYAPAGALCAHGLAFTVLSGLARAWRRAGDGARAHRASGLRLLLPLEGDLQRVIQAEVRALGAAR